MNSKLGTLISICNFSWDYFIQIHSRQNNERIIKKRKSRTTLPSFFHFTILFYLLNLLTPINPTIPETSSQPAAGIGTMLTSVVPPSFASVKL